MMKETISIDEFDGKKFKIRFVEEDDNRKAVLTHYLHNYRNGVKKHFEKDAIQYLNEIIEYKIKEEKERAKAYDYAFKNNIPISYIDKNGFPLARSTVRDKFCII